MNKFEDLIATPTGRTVVITFKSKAKDQDQAVPKVINVYTSLRYSFHVIIAERLSQLIK